MLKESERPFFEAMRWFPVPLKYRQTSRKEEIGMDKRKILIVDDAEINREALAAILEEDYDCYLAADGEEAIAMLEEQKVCYSIVLLDLVMPKVDGYGVLEYMNRANLISEIPVIIVTADNTESAALRAYMLGASDLFLKPYVPSVILKKIDSVLYFSDQKRNDPLTGGFNRGTFLKQAETFLNSVQNRKDYAMFYFDINNLKAVNQMFGSEEGDRLLKLFYNDLVTSETRPDVVARLEADHFVCLAEKSRIDLERISGRMVRSMEISGKKVHVYARFGLYYIDDDTITVSKMIDHAKLAKENIVDASVKPYCVYEAGMSDKYIGQAEALAEFENGMENDEFRVYYQPIIEAQTGHLASAEALVRWEHPEKGLLSPGTFIPALEKNGYITKLDIYMLENVRKRLDEREQEGAPLLPVSVNLSWMDFYDESMRECIFKTFRGNESNKRKIRLEVTETSYAAMEQDNRNLFDHLRELGAKILLDDFGSGYSSFGMIESYDFDILKLDMSFVRKIENNPKSRTIIRKMIELCHELGVKVVAEGAETEEQVQFLKESGCDYIQGYYYSKPLSAVDFAQFANAYAKAGKIAASAVS